MIQWWWLFLVPLAGFWAYYFTHRFYVGAIRQLDKMYKDLLAKNEKASFTDGYRAGLNDGGTIERRANRYQSKYSGEPRYFGSPY